MAEKVKGNSETIRKSVLEQLKGKPVKVQYFKAMGGDNVAYIENTVLTDFDDEFVVFDKVFINRKHIVSIEIAFIDW